MRPIRHTRRGVLIAIGGMPFVFAGCRANATSDGGSAQVALADFGGGPEAADNSGALRSAIAALVRAGGGTVAIGAGVHQFSSASLGQGGISVPTGTTIRGAGRNQTKLRITGDKVCNFFEIVDRSQISFEDFAIIGNNVVPATGSVYGFGAAIRWTLSNAANDDVSGFAVRRVHLENFRGPHWVEVVNSSPSSRNLAMESLRLEDITFVSKRGNSFKPDKIGFNAAAICVHASSGEIRDVLIADVVGDARFIKTGIILFHKVIDAQILRPKISSAGLLGAADNCGGYAIQLYGGFDEMRQVAVVDPIIDGPRSVGIYVAGGTKISVMNPQISGQTDRNDGTLPKGAIAFNGSRDWQVVGGTFRDNWCDLSIVAPALGTVNAAEPVNGSIRGAISEGSANGVLIRHNAGHVGTGISFRDCRWRTTMRSVLIQNDASPAPDAHQSVGGYIDNVEFDRCHLEASAGYRALEMSNDDETPAGGYLISGCKIMGTNPLFAKGLAGSLKIANCFVKDLGTMGGSAAASLIDCSDVNLRDTVLESPGSGSFGIDLRGSSGSVAGVAFRNCAHNLVPSPRSDQLGQEAPRFSGFKGQYVQNLIAEHGQYRGWVCLGGRRWVGTDQTQS